MLKTLREAFAQKDLRRKILITLALMLVYCLGCFLPVPGINPDAFDTKVKGEGANSFLGLLSSLTGGALSKGAFFAIGVSPYITSSIVIQLLTVAIPALARLSKQGSEGRKKLSVITRYVALILATVQAIAIVLSLGDDIIEGNTVLWQNAPDFLIKILVIISLVAGAMLTVWLGDKITEIGVANGMSMLVFVGILTSVVSAFYTSITKIFTEGVDAIVPPLVFLILLIFIFAFIVTFDLAERRIPVTYAKQVKGNKMYGGQSANIPIKLNATGVMPIIFAMALVNFPQMILQMLTPLGSGVVSAYEWYAQYMGSGTVLNIVITSLLILGFSYFYATMVFNPQEVALQIQRNGGFILGYRPGKPTAEYLKKVSHRITLFGALFLMLVALIPSLLFANIPALSNDTALTTSFSSIGMLVLVSVALEFDKSIQNQMLMKQYKGFLK